MSSTKLRNFLGSVLILVLFTACEKKRDEKKSMAPLVAVTNVTKADVPYVVEAQGMVTGSLDVNIYAQVGGVIKSRLFKEGTYVKKGTQLFQIDPAMYKAALSRAEGNLAQAESQSKMAVRDYKRISALFKKDAVSQRVYDESLSNKEKAEANVKVAKAMVEEAKINYDYTKVYAPISGIVRKEAQTVGNLVTPGPGGLLTSMVQISPLNVVFTIPGVTWSYVMAKRVNKQMFVPDMAKYKVEIVLQDGSLYPKGAKLVFIDSSEDLTTGSVSFKAELENEPDGNVVLPGQFVKVRLVGIRYVNAIVIPVKSLIHTASGFAVYTVGDNNIVAPKEVKVLDYVGDQVIIESGLKGGETIISDGIVKARAGQPVTPTAIPVSERVR